MLDMLFTQFIPQFWRARPCRHGGDWRRDSRSEHSLPPRSPRPRRPPPREDRADGRVATAGSKTFSVKENEPRSTWHAAGLTTLYHPTPNVKRVHWDSLNFYTQITAETGQEVDSPLLRDSFVKLCFVGSISPAWIFETGHLSNPDGRVPICSFQTGGKKYSKPRFSHFTIPDAVRSLGSQAQPCKDAQPRGGGGTGPNPQHGGGK